MADEKRSYSTYTALNSLTEWVSFQTRRLASFDNDSHSGLRHVSECLSNARFLFDLFFSSNFLSLIKNIIKRNIINGWTFASIFFYINIIHIWLDFAVNFINIYISYEIIAKWELYRILRLWEKKTKLEEFCSIGKKKLSIEQIKNNQRILMLCVESSSEVFTGGYLNP